MKIPTPIPTIFLPILLILLLLAQTTLAQDESVITAFTRPEDLLDLEGTNYILVSQFNQGSQTQATKVALLDTTTLQRQDLTVTNTTLTSTFRDPHCSPLNFDTQLGAHGMDGYPLRSAANSNWEIAVVNHYERESIEFYELNPTNLTIASMGCVLLPEGNKHEDVSYLVSSNMPRSLAVTNDAQLSCQGTLNLINTNGQVTPIAENLNGPNGVLYVNDNRLLVAETARCRILDMDAFGRFTALANRDVEEIETVLDLAVRLVDAWFDPRLRPSKLTPSGRTSFLSTRIDSPVWELARCELFGGGSCGMAFSVLDYNYATQQEERLYNRGRAKTQFLGGASVALVKNNVLYVGNARTNELLRVENFRH